MIAESYIQDLLSKSDIISIIDSQVKLKRQGKNYSACCPFHDEKTPSFTANQDKQMFYCFGCGAGGDVIEFVSSYQSLNFRDAVKWIASYIGMAFEDSEPEQPTLSRDMREQLEEDNLVIAIYEASDKSQMTYADHKRHKLAVNRIQGIERLQNRN